VGHIHTGPGEHDLTASAFIVDISGDEPKLWLHEHKKLGHWLQFGGHVELQENPWDAIKHEILEEAGFELHQLRILQPKLRLELAKTTQLIPQPVVINSHEIGDTNHYHTDIVFAFVTSEQPSQIVAEDESQLRAMFTLAELEENKDNFLLPNVRKIGMFVTDVLLREWEPVDCKLFDR
jgi:ADP-ribose pyrophosphatase YjhB (NUDIX family)